MFRSTAAASLLLLASGTLAAGALCACTENARDAKAGTVARIDGQPIAASELLAALGVDPLAARTPATFRTALDELIDRRLLLRAARARDIRIADTDVDRAWKRMQAGYPADTFFDQLASEGIDGATLRARLRESLLIERLLVDEVVARVAVTDDEVDAWLGAHPAPDREPERVRAAQIVVRTETEARAIVGELQQGGSFEDLARAHSLSPDARNGGDLGFFARGEMPPPFDEVCFSLAPGKISDVVASSYGFHVFKVLEKRDAREPDPAVRRAEAERALRREKETAAQRAFVARLRQAARIDVDEAALARLVGTP